MSEPNWKAFSALTWTPELFRVLEALDMLGSIPPNGRPQSFRVDEDGKHQAVFTGEGGSFVVHAHPNAIAVGNGNQVLERLGLRKGLVNERALKAWLTLWGWTPPAKATTTEPAAQPMVI